VGSPGCGIWLLIWYGGSLDLSSEHNSGAAKQQSSPAAAEEGMNIYVHDWYGLDYEFEFLPQ